MRILLALVLGVAAACGPSGVSHSDGGANECNPGKTEACYDGQPGTQGVAACRAGTHTCDATGHYGACNDEIVPHQELCGDGVDNNCNGMIDENVDMDHDGVTTCDGDCCDSTECSAPALVNPGAFDVAGDNVDNDCNGVVDDTQLLCDQGLSSGSLNAGDYARAMDICQTATMTEKKWGVISAKLTLADGTGTPSNNAQSIRDHFGTGVHPQGGVNMALFSTGAAAGKGDTNPNYQDFQNTPTENGNNKQSGFPADFFAANGNKLPNAPNCPAPDGNNAFDPVMLTVQVRVPTNAKAFKLKTNFFSSEFPEYACSPFNDFFVILLDSGYTGTPANPTDKNLAFYENNGQKYPVGVNLASGNTGLFTQCKNGSTGCEFRAVAGTISTCTGTDQLTGTGLDQPFPMCNADSLQGGGTGWLETQGNVVPGEIMTLRIAIWDTSDHVLDSIALVDGFQWEADPVQPGTVIFRTQP